MADPTRPSVALAPVADDAAVPGVLQGLLELIDEPLAGLPPGAEVHFPTTADGHLDDSAFPRILR